MSKYKNNFGRTSKEINKMKSQVETELLDVLTVNEKQNFNIDDALFRINKKMEKLLK